MRTIERVTAEGVLTPEVGETATTQQVTDTVYSAIHVANV